MRRARWRVAALAGLVMLAVACSAVLPREWSSAEREFSDPALLASVPASALRTLELASSVPEAMTTLERKVEAGGATLDRVDRDSGIILASLVRSRTLTSYWSGATIASEDRFFAIIQVRETREGSIGSIAWRSQRSCHKPGSSYYALTFLLFLPLTQAVYEERVRCEAGSRPRWEETSPVEIGAPERPAPTVRPGPR